eukprot:jgi/Ulvmu1/5382/UM022_0177.1
MFRHACSIAALSSKCQIGSRSLTLDALVTADTIALRGLQFYGFHGAFPEENKLGQKFRVTAVLYCGHKGLAVAGTSDDLNNSVNYAEAHDSIKSIMEGEPRKLIEAVAEDIAATLLARFPQIHATRICVAKPHVPINGILDSVEVEILRMNDSV